MKQELLFLWFHNHDILGRVGFNFGGKYLFEVDNDNRLSGYLNETYDLNFFSVNKEKTQLINITGLVGENGSGKSTILNYLFKYLPRGHSQNSSYDCILIYTIDDDLFIYYPDYYTDKFHYAFPSEIKQDKKELQHRSQIHKHFDYSILFFSNDFYSKILGDVKNSINMGLRHLLLEGDIERAFVNSPNAIKNTPVKIAFEKHDFFEVKRSNYPVALLGKLIIV